MRALLFVICISTIFTLKSQSNGSFDIDIAYFANSTPFCELSNYRLKMVVNGRGTIPSHSVLVGYSINGGTPSYDTVKFGLSARRIYEFKMPRIAQLDSQAVKIWTSYSADSNPLNDTIVIADWYSAIFQLPYYEDFESWGTLNDRCWSGIGNTDWVIGDSSHIIHRVVPSFDRTTRTAQGQFLYANTWKFQTDEFLLPRIDLSNQSTANLTFWYQSPAFSGSVYIRIYRNPRSQSYDEDTLMGPFQYSQANPWIQYRQDLSTYLGDTIQIGIYVKATIGPPNVTFDDFAITTQPVGFADKDLTADLSIFPNPSNGEFNLKLSDEEWMGERLQIFNSSGQLIKEERIKGQNQQINLEGHPNGLYFLRLQATNVSASKKLVLE